MYALVLQLNVVWLFFGAWHAQAEKCYVQHKLADAARFVHDALIVKQGVLIIAGSAKRMPADVLAALQTV